MEPHFPSLLRDCACTASGHDYGTVIKNFTPECTARAKSSCTGCWADGPSNIDDESSRWWMLELSHWWHITTPNQHGSEMCILEKWSTPLTCLRLWEKTHNKSIVASTQTELGTPQGWRSPTGWRYKQHNHEQNQGPGVWHEGCRIRHAETAMSFETPPCYYAMCCARIWEPWQCCLDNHQKLVMFLTKNLEVILGMASHIVGWSIEWWWKGQVGSSD